MFSGSLSEENDVGIKPPVKKIKEEMNVVSEPEKDSSELEGKTDQDPNLVQIVASKHEVWFEEDVEKRCELKLIYEYSLLYGRYL